MTKLTAGSPAPQFALPDAQGKLVRLSDYAGRRVIVYFYPAALTPGCTTQAIDFTAARQSFADAGYEIIGISPDTPEQLAKFTAKKDLNITLLADPDKRVIQEYGAWGSKMLYGKSLEGVIRSTFVIEVAPDGQGKILQASYNVRAAGHVERLRRELGVQPASA